MAGSRILVFGRSGQVATELARRAEAAGLVLDQLDRGAADLSDPEACARIVAETRADAVINAAAWTAVDRAEEEEEAARRVNAEAPAAMARAAAARGLPFLHVSTDYVFDGSGDRPWRPEDAVAPLGAYGRTKLAGEEGVRAAGGPHAILRTAWVFSAHGGNFVKTMLRLSETRDALRVVEDQVGNPTPAAGIADALLCMARAMAEGQGGGTYHYGGTPAVSWCDFAREIFARAGRAVTVEGIATAEYPTPAARPLNSRLDGSTLTRDFGITPPDWREALDAVLTELKARA
ncbi:dTDP-4-dehydrorhamnose reductase [Pseudoroseicyclus aestuarii]|uniref:dTDP-4-dehydrorhamnose reductase n=1 Tax=Pseudoroseicyclus aestuarii TaxID=1795041 RepID=A0A318SZG8_9RHOB|nr:dTDP-4-dehydrorhamnose reductase [Pseudoroseicyclus aestuarii]PYE82177.1 dTDP-4-dehydrorhamnose reductase [Pseudoroseicyclus aestuarii]